MDLNELRTGIDRIDSQILELFEKRMELCKNVALYKKENNLPIFQSDREVQIIEKIRNRTKNPELKNGTSALFTSIMDISKYLQQQEIMKNEPDIDFIPIENLENARRIGCQGTSGANSETASMMIFKDKPITFYQTFEDVFRAVENGDVDYGIIPVQNSTAGSVTPAYDLMRKYNFHIVRSVCVEITNCLAVKNDIEISDIKCVYSHPQALSQCSDFIEKNNLKAQQYGNTATAAKFISESDENLAVICSEECALHLGLKILAKGISNFIPNYTKFICISKDFKVLPDADTISVILNISNTTGSLYRLLAKFLAGGMNLDRIESRPIKNGSFDAMFYLNFKGNIHEKNVQNLIKGLENELEYFKLLGAYKDYPEA
ncbi:MAG TPA: chorismate mutase [Ruminococcus sp.]|nr:chorismate mutase [Ruminococcus sp.]